MYNSILHLFSCSYQCTFADPCHGGNLPIGFSLFQEGQSQINLFWRELLRSAVFEVGVLSGNRLSCLRSFNDGSPFVLGKRKHDSENQITCKRVFNKSHVQNMNSDTSFKQLPNNLNALNGGSGEAVKFAHHKRVPFLKDFQKPHELGTLHCFPCKRFFHNLLTAVFLQGGNLIFQTVPVPALSGCRYSCVAVNRGFFLRLYDTKF